MFLVHSFISEKFEVKNYSCPGCFIGSRAFSRLDPTKQSEHKVFLKTNVYPGADEVVGKSRVTLDMLTRVG
jgi:hypothetical protein